MRETKPVQLEIFSSSPRNADTEKKPNPLIEYLWNYEKTILILIGFLVVSIVSFSLGVEKGKKIARNNLIQNNNSVKPDQATIKNIPSNTRSTQPAPQPIHRKEALPTQVVKTAQPLQIQTPPKLAGQISNFTIQIASYKTKKYAQAEAEKLNKKGLTTILLPKGDYIVLCVGKFPSQNEARLALRELQKTYKGCYIRRL